jgi:hypothetical protein
VFGPVVLFFEGVSVNDFMPNVVNVAATTRLYAARRRKSSHELKPLLASMLLLPLDCMQLEEENLQLKSSMLLLPLDCMQLEEENLHMN